MVAIAMSRSECNRVATKSECALRQHVSPLAIPRGGPRPHLFGDVAGSGQVGAAHHKSPQSPHNCAAARTLPVRECCGATQNVALETINELPTIPAGSPLMNSNYITFSHPEMSMGGLSNLNPDFPVAINGVRVPTTEHLFHILRYRSSMIQAAILAKESAVSARRLASSKELIDESSQIWMITNSR